MRYILGPDDRVVVDGVPCGVRRSTPTGHVLRAVDSPYDRDEIPHDRFVADCDAGRIEIQRDAFAVAAAAGDHGQPAAWFLADLTEEEVDEALFRLAYVERFGELYDAGRAVRTEEGYADAALVIAEERRVAAMLEAKAGGRRAPRGGRLSTERTPPSRHQLRRWCEAYADMGPAGIPSRTNRSGNRTARHHPTVVEMLDRSVRGYCSRNKPSSIGVHRHLTRMIRKWNARRGTAFDVPSYQTVCDRVNALPFVDKEVGRGSLEAAQKDLVVGRGGLAPRLLLERVEIDEWEVHLSTLLVAAKVWRLLSLNQRKTLAPVRCWLTAAVCCTSRCIVSAHLSLEAPSARTAVAGLRQVLVDKTVLARTAGAQTTWPFYGSPRTLGADKGPGYKSAVFRRIVADLRCTKPNPPAGFPGLRGTIERFFGTLDRGLLQFFTGRTFASVSERGDYDPQAMASLSVEELRRALVRYVCDIYHRSPQKELGGRSPAQVWVREDRKVGVLPPPSQPAMRDIFGIRMVRILGKKGILFAGDHYHSAWLDDLWLTKGDGPVDIRVDFDDLSAISVSVGPARWVSVNSSVGRRLSAADVLAALKLAATQPPTEFDDPDENHRIIDQAFEDLAELGETARLEAGVPDPRLDPKEVARLRAAHERLWDAQAAKLASRALDHLEGLSPPSADLRTVAIEERRGPEAAVDDDQAPSPSSMQVPARTDAATSKRKARAPGKPRFEIRS